MTLIYMEKRRKRDGKEKEKIGKIRFLISFIIKCQTLIFK